MNILEKTTQGVKEYGKLFLDTATKPSNLIPAAIIVGVIEMGYHPKLFRSSVGIGAMTIMSLGAAGIIGAFND